MTANATATTSPRRVVDRIAFVTTTLFLEVVSPPVQLVAWAALTVTASARPGSPAWMAPVAWCAATMCIVAIIDLVGTERTSPGLRMIPTNASAAVLSLTQMALVGIMWCAHGSASVAWTLLAAAFGGLVTIDLADRARFVLRVRRIGGVEGEARRIVAHILATRPDEAHALITQVNIGRRQRSRLHWRLGEALSDENVTLYDREAAAS